MSTYVNAAADRDHLRYHYNSVQSIVLAPAAIIEKCQSLD